MYILSLILFNCVVLFGQSVAQYCLKSETGVEYYGGSQKGFPLYYFNATLNQCCYYCRTTTGCLAWTFNANDLTCSFYSSLPAKRNAKNSLLIYNLKLNLKKFKFDKILFLFC